MLEDHFGEDVAARYDETSASMSTPEVLDPTIDLLAELAGDGAGRVALPLAARGIPVAGVDLSPAMVAQLRAQDGGQGIDVTMGDIATTRVAGRMKAETATFSPLSWG